MAVKSADASYSSTLQKEKEVMTDLSASPYVIQCFADETTVGDNGLLAYNLLLEYASGLPELEVKMLARSILRGLSHVHESGYVHCDLKPDNILLVPKSGGFMAKIGDFGLAKRWKQHSRKRKRAGPEPMYLSPEAVADSDQEAPSDIWAVGCIVLEMLTGRPPWDGKKEEILERLGAGQEIPEIPKGLSKEASDFLKRCLVRKPMFRFTCGMLLNHTFFEGLGDDFDDDEVEELEESEEVAFCSSSSSAGGESEESEEGTFRSSSYGECKSEEAASRDFDRSEVESKEIPLQPAYERKHGPVGGPIIPAGV
ncbi:mitogen-activated protein kinase kinase kinase 20 [Striga hermonthica]|uniref:Mitogen-activated protein kinase kinase kinase 20 n=1 Tax=Striga hermonthica TaxID=68872 RepID=A0A9N7MXF3_STRHE|nr:mitogen-activated protein kinase kinase kinase 20 [Striga hermonthica]